MDKTEELREIIEQASQGNWTPIAIVASFFGLMILLLMYIWKQTLKNNDDRHERSEDLIEKSLNNQKGIQETQVITNEILFELKIKDGFREEAIRRNSSEIKDLQKLSKKRAS